MLDEDERMFESNDCYNERITSTLINSSTNLNNSD